MIYNLPLRRTTLHLAQRLRMDGETFMISNLLTDTKAVSYGQSFDYTLSLFIRPAEYRNCSGVIGQSGREDRLR
jgi:hypothetical protein